MVTLSVTEDNENITIDVRRSPFEVTILGYYVTPI